MPRRRAKRMSPLKLKKLREKQHLEKVKEEKELQTEVVHVRDISFHRTHRLVVEYKDWNCWLKHVTEYWKQFYKLNFRPDESWKDIVHKIEADANDLLAQPSGCFFIRKVTLSTECKTWKTGRHNLITNVPEIGKGVIKMPQVAQDIKVVRLDLLRTPKLFQQSEKYLVEMRKLELEREEIDKKIAKLRIRLRVERGNPDFKLKIDNQHLHSKINEIKYGKPLTAEEEIQKIRKLTENQKNKIQELEVELAEKRRLAEKEAFIEFLTDSISD